MYEFDLIKFIAFTLFALIAMMGCSDEIPNRQSPTESSAVEPVGTLRLGDEAFSVEECVIWGYLGQRNGKWYCRWCIDAEAEGREFSSGEGYEFSTYEVQPSLSANSLPIEVKTWKDLDGIRLTTGRHGEAKFFDNKDHEPIYTLRTMTSYELCSDNVLEIQYVSGQRFRIRWSGEAYLHGIDGNHFELNAIGTLTKVSLSSEVDSKSEVNEEEIAGIFASVFPTGEFRQLPIQMEEFEEDGVVHISFDAEFVPK